MFPVKSSMFSYIHRRRPGGKSVEPGEKGATKVFKHGWKSPWVPTLTGPFPNGQAKYWLLIGHKKCFVLFQPNRRTAPPEFFSWVPTRTLKFESQLAFAFLEGVLENRGSTTSKGHYLWFVIGGIRSLLWFSVFQCSLLMIVVMIDGRK